VSDGIATRAWFSDLYEERGPVDRSEIDAAFREREGVIVKRAIASVIEDLFRTTGQRPIASVETDPALLISYWSVSGRLKRRCCLSSSAVDELDLIVVTVRDMQDVIREDLNRGWPQCPRHQLGLRAGVTDQTPVWWCHFGDGHAVSEIGQLGCGREGLLRA